MRGVYTCNIHCFDGQATNKTKTKEVGMRGGEKENHQCSLPGRSVSEMTELHFASLQPSFPYLLFLLSFFFGLYFELCVICVCVCVTSFFVFLEYCRQEKKHCAGDEVLYKRRKKGEKDKKQGEEKQKRKKKTTWRRRWREASTGNERRKPTLTNTHTTHPQLDTNKVHTVNPCLPSKCQSRKKTR